MMEIYEIKLHRQNIEEKIKHSMNRMPSQGMKRVSQLKEQAGQILGRFSSRVHKKF